MILAFDIDGCFADFTTTYGELLIKTSGKDLLPPGWRTDPNFPSVWYWEREAGYGEWESKVWTEIILPGDKFWKELKPLPSADMTLRHINRLAKQHDVYFLTHRPGKSAKSQTEEWLYEFGINYPTVIVTGDKAPILKAIGADFFVDDKWETVAQVSDLFYNVKPIHLFLQDAPYNRHIVPNTYERTDSVADALTKAGL